MHGNVQPNSPQKLYIVKIGGNVIDDESMLSSFLADFAAIDAKKILIHGGGKMGTRVAEEMGVKQEMVDGRRITDKETLKIVTMVYAGYINKNIVAKLQSLKCNALGLTGADGNLVAAHKRSANPVAGSGPLDFGFVGDIEKVNVDLINFFLQQDITLVIAPITHDAKGQLLNTNADTIAREVAKTMSAKFEVCLLYCFDKPGVLRDPADDNSVIPDIGQKSFKELKAQKLVSAGMIPKLENAFAALSAGVKTIVIGNAAQLQNLILAKSGTSIVNE